MSRSGRGRLRAIQTWNQNWRVREMSRLQGEDDGSVLKYVTEDEPQRARQIARYTILELGADCANRATVVAIVVVQVHIARIEVQVVRDVRNALVE